MPSMTPLPTDDVYQWMLRLAGVGILVDTLERLWRAHEYRDRGSFSWVVLRQRFAAWPPALRRACDLACEGAGRTQGVLVIRLLALVATAALPVGTPGFAAGLSLLLATQLYLLLREAGFGLDGADVITLIVCGAAWIGTVPSRDPVVARAGLWFVAAQACLAYFKAGHAKIVGSRWRSGEALIAILSTRLGHPVLAKALRARPRLSQLLCWSVLLWELAFPLVLLAPARWALALLASGVLFHASVAAIMGINTFLWAFPATYGALFWARGSW